MFKLLLALLAVFGLDQALDLSAKFGISPLVSNIGGIVGYSRLSEISVMHCYHIGVLSSSGFDGDSDTNVSDTYYLNIPVGIPEEVAGYASGIGLTGTEMMRAESFFGFDFTDVWTMEGNAEYPYPELKALPMPYRKEQHRPLRYVRDPYAQW